MNVGGFDRIARLTVAAILAFLLFNGNLEISSITGIIAAVVAGIFTFTALLGWCPLYQLFGASTCPVESHG